MAKAILLAEDSAADELLFRRVMKKNSVANPVIVVRDGGEAIDYLEGRGDFADRAKYPIPEVIVLDWKMPRVDGFAVLEWLKKNPAIKKDVLIIVMSQYGDAAQIRRAYDLGASCFLPKPFTLADSENLVRHFVDYWKRPVRARCEQAET